MLMGLALEPIAEVRMRNRNHRLGARGDGFALQIDDAILCNPVHDVGAGCRHDIALREIENDPAFRRTTFVIGSGQADEGFATLRGVATANELQLSPGAADMAVFIAFGSSLTLQVNLGGIVDRHSLVILRDDMRQIRVACRAGFAGCGV